MKELGEYLRETRENNYVSIAEAAEDLKIPEITISNIESGNTRAFRDMYELKDKVKEYAKYLGANAIHPHYAVALQAPGLIEGCKASGVAIHPWTVDSIDTMRKLMSMGVDAIITDKPDEAVKIRRNL